MHARAAASVMDICRIALANEAVQVFSRIVDMPAGRGNVILTFTLTSTRHSADIPPYTFASDVQVMVIKKQALGISVV